MRTTEKLVKTLIKKINNILFAVLSKHVPMNQVSEVFACSKTSFT